MARAAPAAPQNYRLDAAGSQVTFSYTLNGRHVTGRMPVRSARVALDLRRLPASSVRVTLDAARARAGVFFATAAMRGPKVLDTAAHPLIRFRTTAIRGSLRAATVTGRLTIRGITRPVTLDAVLGRQTGTPADRARQAGRAAHRGDQPLRLRRLGLCRAGGRSYRPAHPRPHHALTAPLSPPGDGG